MFEPSPKDRMSKHLANRSALTGLDFKKAQQAYAVDWVNLRCVTLWLTSLWLSLKVALGIGDKDTAVGKLKSLRGEISLAAATVNTAAVHNQ